MHHLHTQTRTGARILFHSVCVCTDATFVVVFFFFFPNTHHIPSLKSNVALEKQTTYTRVYDIGPRRMQPDVSPRKRNLHKVLVCGKLRRTMTKTDDWCAVTIKKIKKINDGKKIPHAPSVEQLFVKQKRHHRNKPRPNEPTGQSNSTSPTLHVSFSPSDIHVTKYSDAMPLFLKVVQCDGLCGACLREVK